MLAVALPHPGASKIDNVIGPATGAADQPSGQRS